MKRLFILLFLLTVIGPLQAQDQYQFRAGHPQGFSIESSTKSTLSLHYSITEISIANTKYEEVQGQEIIMKGCFGSFAEGLPNLPFENRYVAVPHGATVNIEVKEKASQTLHDIELLPATPLQLDNEDTRPALRWDETVFGKNANFPSENVTIAQATQIRGLDVVLLSVTPFRYNPMQKTLEVIYDMDIEVRFEGGDGQFGDPRYRNSAWDGILRDMVVNSDMLPEAHYYEHLNEAIQNREEGCEYLIITPNDPDFLAWADTLKQFRTKQGILTKVVTTTECGSNEAEDIRNYILNAYENWAIPPAAVLLFSGNHVTNPNFGIKPFFLTSPVSWGETYRYASDNPYSDMNGDSIPDLALSRMTVHDVSECQLMVKKLIGYELDPPTDTHYYDHPVINSGYQDTKWFAITAQVTNNFFHDRHGMHPANIYMKYYLEDHDPTPPDSIWSIAPNSGAVLDYFGPNGAQYLPSSIGYLDDWIDMNDKMPFRLAVCEGSFITFYRDHSNPDWWCCSNIRPSDMASFQNQRPTFLFSIGCSTNNFWNNWSYDGCVAESFLHAEVGSIGSLGANSVTYSHYNDLITWGMFDYFWPDYLPTLGCHTEPEFALPSYSLVAGKLFLRQQAFLPYSLDNEKVDKTLNLFSFLGETYLNLYTEMPQPMAIEASPYHSYGQREYPFTAEEGATVCVSKDGEIIQVLQGTGQPQSVMLPSLEIGKQFTFTATKQNRFRFQQTVEIIPEAQAYVYVKNMEVIDHDGNGQLDYGETASIDLQVHNSGGISSQGATVQLLCDSPYIEILQGTSTYPNIAPNAECSIQNAFQIRLSNNVPDQTLLCFKVQFNESQNTHCDAMTVEANAPDLYIEPEFRPMTADGEPSTHIATEGPSKLSFTVTNKGHSSAGLLHANLDIKAPFVAIEYPQLQHESLAPNEAYSFTYELNTTPNDITGAWLQSHFNVQHMEHRIWLDTIVQYGGIFEDFETDTLNPLFGWRSDTDSPWTFCDDDAFEGQRSFEALSENHYLSPWLENQDPNYSQMQHPCKVSFYYRTSPNGTISFRYYYDSQTVFLPTSDDWLYFEQYMPNRYWSWTWRVHTLDDNPAIGKIDNICFPPKHTTIANAGNDIIACDEEFVVLYDAYAYDCDSILWTTDGDGRFDRDTVANPFYYPGSQDIENGSVALTLTAFGNDTIVSTTRIHFADDVSLGKIAGDSVVNKYSNPISHYSVENPEGMHHSWYLEPTEAGIIYGFGDAIDILWYQNEGDTEATLWAWADHGCESVSKHIRLIGFSASEWHTADFELYPNPTDGKVNLVIGETLQGKSVIEVYNLLGERMLMRQASQLRQGETISLDLSEMAPGLYIIKLSTENGSCAKKVSVW